MPWFSQRVHRLVRLVAVVPLATVLTVVPTLLTHSAQATHSVQLSPISRDELVSPVARLAQFEHEQVRKQAHDARLTAVVAAHLGVLAYWQAVQREAVHAAAQAALRAAEAAARSATAQQPPQAATGAYSGSQALSAPTSTGFGGMASVVQCIKHYESGNYSESSHPSSGSGAYQFIPGTWQSYDRLAGYPGGVYSLAYLAPPWVQDAVLAYALTHGGAHNWDPKYGNDPCTVGLP